MDTRAKRYFVRITKNNITESGEKVVMDIEKVFNNLCDKGYNVVYATHEPQEPTEHYHLIIQSETQIRFTTLKKMIPYGFIEQQKGTNQQAHDYLLHIDPKSRKNGKKEYNADIIRHNIQDFDEWLAITPGKRVDIDNLKTQIEAGALDYQLANEDPQTFARYSNFITRYRRALNEDKGKQERESLKVYYFYGDTGTGKSYTARQHSTHKDTFVVTDYKNPWDNYNGQKTLILEEYRNNFTMTQLLTYLDHYPVELPARYQNNYACWTTVFIISNIPPIEQYPNVDQATKKAFYRRLTEIKRFQDHEITSYKIDSNNKPTNIASIPNPKHTLD